MKKSLVTLLVVITIAGLGFLAYWVDSARRTAATAPALETAEVQRGDLAVVIEAAGSLLPPSEVTLAFESGGQVADVLAVEGQTVGAGDVLARLDSNALELQLAQAELNLQLLTSPEAIAQAELAVLDAREALDDAERDLVSIQHPDVEDYRQTLDDALIALDNAQSEATLTSLGGETGAVIAAQDAVERAAERLGAVQSAENGCGGCDPTRLADAQDDYNGAVNALTSAQINLQMAQTAQQQTIRDAQETGDDAEADLAAALAGPDPADVALYEARVENTQQALSAAEALLADLRSGLTYESLSGAPRVVGTTQGQLRQAILSVQSAQLALEKAALIAPSSGTVTAVRANLGEIVGPGAPVMVVSGLDSLQAEVNLDETDVARIHAEMLVAITVDAFPGVEVSGQVSEIAPTADVQSGVVLYPVTVRLDPTDLPLRSGMTINVTFPIEKRTDTLLVPFRAVETQGEQAYVTQVTASGSERVAVTLGLITDTQVEILSGLQEGDVVTVYANPVQDAELMSNPMFGGGQ